MWRSIMDRVFSLALSAPAHCCPIYYETKDRDNLGIVTQETPLNAVQEDVKMTSSLDRLGAD